MGNVDDGGETVSDRVETCGSVLRAAGLIEYDNVDEPSEIRYRLTAMGKTFIRGCRPPKAKE
jgi:hypothetical protein